jgi:hypothetical protein
LEKNVEIPQGQCLRNTEINIFSIFNCSWVREWRGRWWKTGIHYAVWWIGRSCMLHWCGGWRLGRAGWVIRPIRWPSSVNFWKSGCRWGWERKWRVEAFTLILPISHIIYSKLEWEYFWISWVWLILQRNLYNKCEIIKFLFFAFFNNY